MKHRKQAIKNGLIVLGLCALGLFIGMGISCGQGARELPIVVPSPTATVEPTATPTPEPTATPTPETYTANEVIRYKYCEVLLGSQEMCDVDLTELLEKAREEDLAEAKLETYSRREIPILLVETHILPVLWNEPDEARKREVCAKDFGEWQYQLGGGLSTALTYAQTNEFYGLMFRVMRARYFVNTLVDNCARFELHEAVE